MKNRAATPPPETIIVTSKRLSCDGGTGSLGHPRVFLEMGSATQVECPYCDRLFVLKPGSEDDGH